MNWLIGTSFVLCVVVAYAYPVYANHRCRRRRRRRYRRAYHKKYDEPATVEETTPLFRDLARVVYNPAYKSDESVCVDIPEQPHSLALPSSPEKLLSLPPPQPQQIDEISENERPDETSSWFVVNADAGE